MFEPTLMLGFIRIVFSGVKRANHIPNIVKKLRTFHFYQLFIYTKVWEISFNYIVVSICQCNWLSNNTFTSILGPNPNSQFPRRIKTLTFVSILFCRFTSDRLFFFYSFSSPSLLHLFSMSRYICWICHIIFFQ